MKNILFAALLCTFVACSEAGTTEKTETTKSVQESKPATNSNIKNGIVVNENGLKVERAMLMTEDGTPLGDDNKIGVGEYVLCRFFLSGWKAEEGKVKIGASQIIETNDGEVVLEESDLFANMEAVSVDDAGVITLKAVITELKKSVRDFVVKYKIWDKTSNANVSGEFYFSLK